MKTKVYVLKDPITNEIRYVGITTRTLEERLKGHLIDVTSRPDLNYHKINWLRKLQKGGLIPKIEQIDELDTLEEAKEKEIEYIAKFKELYNLTNCTLGGDYMGFKAHDRDVILKKKNTRPITQYDIFGGKIADYEIMEDAVRALGLTSGSKLSMCCKGKRPNAHGYIWRYKGDPLGDISMNDPQSLDYCDLIQCDMEGNEIRRWDSYKEAGESIGDNSRGGNIAACVKGRQKSCKNYTWKVEYKLKRGSL